MGLVGFYFFILFFSKVSLNWWVVKNKKIFSYKLSIHQKILQKIHDFHKILNNTNGFNVTNNNTCDTEDYSNDAENPDLYHSNKFEKLF